MKAFITKEITMERLIYRDSINLKVETGTDLFIIRQVLETVEIKSELEKVNLYKCHICGHHFNIGECVTKIFSTKRFLNACEHCTKLISHEISR